MDTVLVGLSRDGVESHKRFAAKYDLQPHLIADPNGAILERLGVRNANGTARRTTFLIDKAGTVRRVFENVSARGHADEVLAAVADL